MNGRVPTTRSSGRLTTTSGSRRKLADIAAATGLSLAGYILYRHALRLYWLFDDPFHLRFLLEQRVGDYLLQPGVANQAALSVHLTIFLLSHDFDLSVFGLAPAAHYAHQLITVVACALALYGVLRLWIAPWAAAVGGMVWMLGPAVAASAPLLMVRHFFEALLFAAGSVAAFVVALRRGRQSWAALSAGACLVAVMLMEIAVVVPLVLLLLPEKDLRQRARLLVPHAVAGLIYVAYRLWILRALVATYGWAIDEGGAARLALALPAKLAVAMTGGRGLPGVLLITALVAGALALSWSGALRIAAILAAAALPLVPFSTEMQPRYALVPWTVLAVGLAVAGARLAGRGRHGRWLAAALAAAALAGAAAAGRSTWRDRLADLERMSLENRFLARAGERDVLSHPASAASTLGELQRLRALAGESGAAAAWLRDELYLCLGRADGKRLWEFDAATGAVREVPAESRAARERACGEVRWDAPLEARFSWREQGLFWRLGPYSTPAYAIVFGDGAESIPVPPRGGYRIAASDLALRVRYADPAGWLTYSPELRLERGEPERSWRRP
ncbi:MAG TPA: hypothetical protein VFE44_05825 [Thermoanaerobaculia bacterium]|nr:hypothetical protein [Thermoanaerobaculia bacterium]